MARAPKGPKQVETLVHDEARRRNIPTAELQSTAEYLEEKQPPRPALYPRARPLAPGERRMREEDLDPQIIWNGARIRLAPGAGGATAGDRRGFTDVYGIGEALDRLVEESMSKAQAA